MKKEEWILIDLFSGIGGFIEGFTRAGYEFAHHYSSDIDKFTNQVYRYHYGKNHTELGSVVDVRGGKIRERHPGARFIVTFGFPCQDLSLAGRRKGFTGERSSLYFEAIRIIEELRPDVWIAENVKGFFSSNGGRDFTIALITAANLGNYITEWQLCDTEWVLPQSRERIFLIGHARGRSVPGVFPITGTGSKIGTCQERGVSGSVKDQRYGRNDGTYLKVYTQRSFDGNNEDGSRAWREHKKPDQTPTLPGNMGTGGNNMPFLSIQKGMGSKKLKVRKDVRQINPSKEGFGKQPKQQDRVYDSEGVSPALCGSLGSPNISVKREAKPVKWSRTEKGKEERRRNMAMGRDYTPFGEGHRELVPRDGDSTGCLTGAFNKDTLIADSVNESLEVRKLTPVESERLQGFRDGHTATGLTKDGHEVQISKNQRYKMLGNAVTVDIIQMIAEKLKRCIT